TDRAAAILMGKTPHSLELRAALVHPARRDRGVGSPARRNMQLSAFVLPGDTAGSQCANSTRRSGSQSDPCSANRDFLNSKRECRPAHALVAHVSRPRASRTG